MPHPMKRQSRRARKLPNITVPVRRAPAHRPAGLLELIVATVVVCFFLLVLAWGLAQSPTPPAWH